MKEITVDAVLSNVGMITKFIDEQLEMMDCPVKIQMQIDIAIDEIFSNIANYAYGGLTGKATISIEEVAETHSVKIAFSDEGNPYNPLMKKDPDVTLSVEERPIGGLGIFMVKKTMDDIQYEYVNGKNVLSIWKEI